MDSIFPTVIGNSVLKNGVGRDIRSGHNSHAYIIEGAPGTGKRTAAELIASAVSCEHRYDADYPLPCGECLNCRKIKKGISPDIVVINKGDKASIGVEAIRSLREGLYVTPNDSEVRTYIIEEAEKLTDQAQNALLLSIEEPPPFVLFLLLTEDSSKLLETIRSRAQRIRCQSFSANEVAEYLKELPGGAEMYRKDPLKFASCVSLSGGSLGKAAELLRGSDGAGDLLKSRSVAAEIVSGFAASDCTSLLKMIPKIPKSAEEAKQILFLTDNALADLCAVKNSDGGTARLSFFISDDEALECAPNLSYMKLLHLHDCICSAVIKIDTNVPIKTVFTDFIFSGLKYRRQSSKG